MSWATILVLAAGAYAWKALGMFGLARVPLRGTMLHLVQLLPAALLAALTALTTLDGGDAATVLTRSGGVALGAIAAWRRAPLIVVLLVASTGTALLRAVT